jgi:peptidoglycan/LPS O-acetylase OafA/YrhL
VQVVQLSRTPLWRWLEHPGVRYVGRISYPMYLWHAWGLSAASHVTLLRPGGRFALGVAFTLGLASASYFLVEKPFLRLKRRYELHRASP